jgi:hypothetical protein
MGINSTATLLPLGEFFAKRLFYSNMEDESDRLLEMLYSGLDRGVCNR